MYSTEPNKNPGGQGHPDYAYAQHDMYGQPVNQNYGGGMYPSHDAQWGGQSYPTYPSQPVFNEQMASMAMQYGQQFLAGQGKELVNEKLGKYMSLMAKLKYYFAVDTVYVFKKLLLILFPFTHKDWAVHYNEEQQPVQPRFDINAPDLYIPSMAFVTYILTAGLLLGLQNKFGPEQLGKQASSALGWLVLEIMIVMLTHYLLNISSSCLKFLDIVVFCCYKFTCMIIALLVSIPLGYIGYVCVLIYSTCSLDFFLLRTLRVAILTKSNGEYTGGQKRTVYMLTLLCTLQPLMMYWLTYHLLPSKTVQPA